MTLSRIAGTLLAVGSLMLAAVAQAETPVKATAVSGAEAEAAVLGTWEGEWTNDISGGSGTVTIDITDAAGGSVTGSGAATGGKCAGDFRVTGWYRASLAELRLALPDGGGECPAAEVSISMRMGKQAGKVVSVGHWANMIDGKAAGKAFGFVHFTKK